MTATFCAFARGSVTQMNRRSKYRHAWASPMPRLPELDSTTTDRPGTTSPRSIASASITYDDRSLMLPPGLAASSFANVRKGLPGSSRFSDTSGVAPIVESTPASWASYGLMGSPLPQTPSPRAAGSDRTGHLLRPVHAPPQARRAHVRPHATDVVQALGPGTGRALRVPARRQLPVGRPDRVLLLVVAHDAIDALIDVLVCHGHRRSFARMGLSPGEHPASTASRRRDERALRPTNERCGSFSGVDAGAPSSVRTAE